MTDCDRNVAGRGVCDNAGKKQGKRGQQRTGGGGGGGGFYLPFDEAGGGVRRRAAIGAFEAALAFGQLPGQL